MTVAYDVADCYTSERDEWFRHVGTTTPPVIYGTRKFITCAVMAGLAVSGTLPVVTPFDATAAHPVVVHPGTLPAFSTFRPRLMNDQRAVPGMLQRLRRVSGLNWGEVGRALGVSRRTVHNWLSGGRVAGVHFTRLLETIHVVDLVATGSAETTRAALLHPNRNGRSIIDELALTARPARRPLASVSVGDMVTPVDENVDVSIQDPQRPSSLRGGPLPRRQLHE